MSNRSPPSPKFSGSSQRNAERGVPDNETLTRRVEEVEYRNEILRAENKALKDMVTKVNKKLGERNKALEAENKALKQKVLDRSSRLEFEARQLKDRLAEVVLADSKSKLQIPRGQKFSGQGQDQGERAEGAREGQNKNSDSQRKASASPHVRRNDEPDLSKPSSWYDEYTKYEV